MEMTQFLFRVCFYREHFICFFQNILTLLEKSYNIFNWKINYLFYVYNLLI